MDENIFIREENCDLFLAQEFPLEEKREFNMNSVVETDIFISTQEHLQENDNAENYELFPDFNLNNDMLEPGISSASEKAYLCDIMPPLNKKLSLISEKSFKQQDYADQYSSFESYSCSNNTSESEISSSEWEEYLHDMSCNNKIPVVPRKKYFHQKHGDSNSTSKFLNKFDGAHKLLGNIQLNSDDPPKVSKKMLFHTSEEDDQQQDERILNTSFGSLKLSDEDKKVDIYTSEKEEYFSDNHNDSNTPAMIQEDFQKLDDSEHSLSDSCNLYDDVKTAEISTFNTKDYECNISSQVHVPILSIVREEDEQQRDEAKFNSSFKSFTLSDDRKTPDVSNSDIEEYLCNIRHEPDKRNVVNPTSRKKFCRKSVLTQHLKTHTTEKTGNSLICHMSFSRRDAMKAHNQLLHKEKSLICPICKKYFYDKYSLKAHIALHSNTKPPTSAGVKDYFRKNKKSNRNGRIKSKHMCVTCNKKFPGENQLKKHMLVHSGSKHTCLVGNKGFSRKCSMKLHLSEHSGEKSHICPTCHKIFSHNHKLKRHMSVHIGKSHICSVCNKGFSRNDNLMRHMSEHGDKSHTCSVCSKGFSRTDLLKKHMVVHSEEKPYECLICNKSFSLKDKLTAHTKRMHVK